MKKKEKVAPVQRAKADIIRETLFAATPPEDISESVIKRDMVNNIICYKRHKNNRYADYHCQQCGAEYTLCTDYDDPLYQCEIPVINHEFTCPKCGEKGTLKYLCNIKNTRYYYNTVTYRLLPDTTLVITLYWSLVKRYINGIRSIETHESYRVYLKRNSVKIYELCYWKNQWNQVQRIKYINTNTINSEALGTGNIGHSDLSYCQLKEMARATFGRLHLINNQNECNIMVLMAYAKYPGIETLFKNGLSDIVKFVILRGSSNLISKKETKANRILGISKEQYHWLVSSIGGNNGRINQYNNICTVQGSS